MIEIQAECPPCDILQSKLQQAIRQRICFEILLLSPKRLQSRMFSQHMSISDIDVEVNGRSKKGVSCSQCVGISHVNVYVDG